MKLYAFCKNCENEISVKERATDRGVLLKKHGREMTLTCPDCGETASYHINRIYAKSGGRPTLIGLLVLLLGTPVMFYFLYPYITHWNVYEMHVIAPIFIPAFAWLVIIREEQRKVIIFNDFRISEYKD